MGLSQSLAARNTLANVCRHHPTDEKKKTDARRNLAEAKIADYVQKVVSSAPPLTDEQLERIAGLLRAGGGQ